MEQSSNSPIIIQSTLRVPCHQSCMVVTVRSLFERLERCGSSPSVFYRTLAAFIVR
jgi:hypothetical protein